MLAKHHQSLGYVMSETNTSIFRLLRWIPIESRSQLPCLGITDCSYIVWRCESDMWEPNIIPCIIMLAPVPPYASAHSSAISLLNTLFLPSCVFSDAVGGFCPLGSPPNSCTSFPWRNRSPQLELTLGKRRLLAAMFSSWAGINLERARIYLEVRN